MRACVRVNPLGRTSASERDASDTHTYGISENNPLQFDHLCHLID